MTNPAAQQEINHSRNFMPNARVFGALAAAGALALGAAGQASAAGAQERAPGSDPLIFLMDAQQQTMDAHPGYINHIGREDLLSSVSASLMDASVDETSRVVISKPSKKGAVKLKLTQVNGVGVVSAAALQAPDDLDADRIQDVQYAYDGDLMSKKTTTITPMLKQKNGKLRKWGKSVVVNSDYTYGTPADPFKEIPSGTTGPRQQLTRNVTIKPKKMSKAQLKKGNLYVKVAQDCKVDPQFVNPRFELQCKTNPYSKSYRVRASGNTTYLSSGSLPSGADVILQRGRAVK